MLKSTRIAPYLAYFIAYLAYVPYLTWILSRLFLFWFISILAGYYLALVLDL